MESSLPIFIDLPEKEQANEIRQYLLSAGADLSGNSKENIHEELFCLLDACDNWLKSACDADLEALMNSFVSLILFCGYDEKLSKKFSTKLVEIGETASNALLRIKILNNLFTGLPYEKPLRFDTYLAMLRLASKFGFTNSIETQLKVVNGWLELWNTPMDQRRTCYRELHTALKVEQKSEEATKVMLQLLSTYDETSAKQAKDDAEKCIIDFIIKPDIFIMDHLLLLKPVEVLKGELIYQLLEIFVSGSLSQYKEFYSKHQDLCNRLGLVHEDNVQKMRILTMLSLSIENKEISFSQIKEVLHLNEDEIEEFVIDVVKSKLVHAKIDQIQEKVVIRSTSRRSFGKPEWVELEGKLEAWLNNLSVIRTSLEQVVQTGG